jgi:hypothetical protein
MLMSPEVLDTLGSRAPRDVRVLPGFDEYLLGYKDRSLMVAEEHKQAIVPGGNGVFQSTVVRDGEVVATWKRTTAKAQTVVAVFPLTALRAGDRAAVQEAFEAYQRYLARPLAVRWSPG